MKSENLDLLRDRMSQLPCFVPFAEAVIQSLQFAARSYEHVHRAFHSCGVAGPPYKSLERRLTQSGHALPKNNQDSLGTPRFAANASKASRRVRSRIPPAESYAILLFAF